MVIHRDFGVFVLGGTRIGDVFCAIDEVALGVGLRELLEVARVDLEVEAGERDVLCLLAVDAVERANERIFELSVHGIHRKGKKLRVLRFLRVRRIDLRRHERAHVAGLEDRAVVRVDHETRHRAVGERQTGDDGVDELRALEGRSDDEVRIGGREREAVGSRDAGDRFGLVEGRLGADRQIARRQVDGGEDHVAVFVHAHRRAESNDGKPAVDLAERHDFVAVAEAIVRRADELEGRDGRLGRERFHDRARLGFATQCQGLACERLRGARKERHVRAGDDQLRLVFLRERRGGERGNGLGREEGKAGFAGVASHGKSSVRGARMPAGGGILAVSEPGSSA